MGLSSDLISQFVKATNDNAKTKKETSTVYGTVVGAGEQKYVQFDGSKESTPVSTTVDVKEGDRVIVMIKNHSATITGNLKDPSASSEVLYQNANEVSKKITELDIAVANRVTTDQLNASNANIADELTAKDAVIKNELTASIVEVEKKLTAKDVEIEGKVTANEGEITNLKTNKLDVEAATATYATIVNLDAVNENVNNLNATHAKFENATAENFKAANASISELNTKKLDAESAKVTYANIDFSNIGEAAIRKFFSESGMIDDLVVSDGTITGKLVGVTISGDLIEGNTVKADKLVVKGSDGLYYKLNIDAGATTSAEVSTEDLQNGLHGTAIIAKTITAEKISVDDLVAFGADIAGFHITEQNTFYSGTKSSVSNTTRGIYMDDQGQFALGDSGNYIKYYKDSDGSYKLDISMMKNYATKSDIDAVNSKIEHDQLVSNGGGELGNNTNFSSWIFDGTVTNNSAGSFTRNDTVYNVLRTDEAFLVNPQKEYTLKVDARSKNSKASLYSFLMFLDADKNEISAEDHMYVPGTLTTLAQDLNPGDTTIYLADISKWSTTAYSRNVVIFWCHSNSYGYKYPEETYSRVHYRFPSDANGYLDPQYVDAENNALILPTPWTGVSVPAGTKVSQGGTGATYKYLITNVIPGTEWSTYSGKIIGTDYSGENLINTFPPGTAYAKIGFLWNFNSADDKLWVTNVGVRDTTEITDTQNAMEAIRASIKVNADSITSVVAKTNSNANSISSLAASTDQKINSIQVGGRNLLPGTDFDGASKRHERLEGASSEGGFVFTPTVQIESGVDYTASADIRGNANINLYELNSVGGNLSHPMARKDYLSTEEYRRFVVTFSVDESRTFNQLYICTEWGEANTPVGSWFEIAPESLKLERGNKPTDWTPAPEDMATAKEVDTAQSTANNADEKASNAQTLIAQLSESISMLVTDGNGTSLMTQTEDGWTFSTATIQGLVNEISDNLNSLTEEVGGVSGTVDVVKQAVDDLGEIAEYVNITTYEDEPCIELGEADSEFKLRITNTRMMFTEGATVLAYFTNQAFNSKKVVIEEELQQGGFVWKVRSNGNLGLTWKGGTS